ncbi:MAG: hypothetical protein FJ035_05610 [Chloroflexi bacterium]|nr:hypothetical protein [Chloroflexota bacterium]
MKKIWDRDVEMVYCILQAGPTAFDVLQSWLRGWRSSGPLGTTSYFYDWGAQVHNIWLDKQRERRAPAARRSRLHSAAGATPRRCCCRPRVRGA